MIIILNQKINCFINVVNSGSFSAAAQKLYISQSAVSQQIKSLESELEVELFDRSYYRPILTKAGEYYYNKCTSLINNYQIITQETKKIAAKDDLELFIGVVGPLEEKHLPQIISQYKKNYNDVRLNIKKISFEEAVTQLENHKLDLAFSLENQFKNNKAIIDISLLKIEICVICSKNHPWAKRDFIENNEINDQKIIYFSKSSGTKIYFDFIKSLKRNGISPNIVKKVDELEELLLAVQINQGISLIAKEVVVDNPQISIVNLKNNNHNVNFCLGYLKANSKKFLVEFAKITKKYFTSLKDDK